MSVKQFCFVLFMFTVISLNSSTLDNGLYIVRAPIFASFDFTTILLTSSKNGATGMYVSVACESKFNERIQ